jgi:mitochondrial fusion and transport protein UGO1
MASGGSLRDHYAPPPPTWTFSPGAGSDSSVLPSGPTPSSSYTYESRPAPNSLFELSPSLAAPGGGGASGGTILKAIVAAGFLQYTTSAIAMPWDVGQLLMQAQWVPRDADAVGSSHEEEEDEEEEEVRLEVMFYIIHKSVDWSLSVLERGFRERRCIFCRPFTCYASTALP